MNNSAAILNEREARDAKATIAEMDHALSSEQYFEPTIVGLPPEVVNGYRKALLTQREEVRSLLDAYESAKEGDHSELVKRAGNDPGMALIVARIACGHSQKELARRLGLKEQQIQRYEADRYRSISLSNYKRVAHVLGVRWEMRMASEAAPWIGSGWDVAKDIRADDVKKIIKHAKANNWFEDDKSILAEEQSHSYLQRYISDHILSYGSPTLLRTGLNVEDMCNDLLLLAWKARVTRIAEQVIENTKISYSGLNISWLTVLVGLSKYEDGPARSRDYLLEQGIVLVIEPQITGLKLDGAAFLVGSIPVIGLTLRRDTIDNFWFTLMHEVAHIILHYRTGLSIGFFDDTEIVDVDEIEKEANDFASNMLISSERWKRSPARIAKTSEPIEKFAKELGIHPAIVFGRIQKERENYAIFSNKIGRGAVRKSLL